MYEAFIMIALVGHERQPIGTACDQLIGVSLESGWEFANRTQSHQNCHMPALYGKSQMLQIA